MENKGHFCYNCNEFFHDSNSKVIKHINCKQNRGLGICVDSKEFNKPEVEVLEIPVEVMTGLFRIMCGISSSFSGAEVYPNAIKGMEEAHKWIIEYGKKNNIESRGNIE